MVRTRGLGHALARIIGRGIQDEHDTVDVSRGVGLLHHAMGSSDD